MEQNKALAIFLISEDRYGYGYGENYDTIEGARQRALKECRTRQADYDKVEEVCRIYMVNDEKVGKK